MGRAAGRSIAVLGASLLALALAGTALGAEVPEIHMQRDPAVVSVVVGALVGALAVGLLFAYPRGRWRRERDIAAASLRTAADAERRAPAGPSGRRLVPPMLRGDIFGDHDPDSAGTLAAGDPASWPGEQHNMAHDRPWSTSKPAPHDEWLNRGSRRSRTDGL